jgi:hypothetical protein
MKIKLTPCQRRRQLEQLNNQLVGRKFMTDETRTEMQLLQVPNHK